MTLQVGGAAKKIITVEPLPQILQQHVNELGDVDEQNHGLSLLRPWVLRQLAEHCITEISPGLQA